MEPNERKPSAFEYIASLGLPALAIVAAILAGRQQRRIAIAFVILACASYAIGLYPSIASALRRWRAHRRAEAIARSAFPEFRKFVRRFENFVDGQQHDTLHDIAQSDLCQGNGSAYNKLGLPDMIMWSSTWRFFADRVEYEEPTILELHRAIEEFHNLVGSYNDLCVAVVFERLPQDLQAGITPETRVSLNSLQQRLSSFLSDYQDFVNELADATPALKDVPRYFALPKPL
jgi:hypothetical protein